MVEDYIKGWCKMKCEMYNTVKYAVFIVENMNDVSRRVSVFLGIFEHREQDSVCIVECFLGVLRLRR